MKNSIFALALVLAFSFVASPAEAGLTVQQKCNSGKLLAAAKFSQCRIKVDFLAVKKGAKLSAEKKSLLQTKCAEKLRAEYAKLEAKYVPTSQIGLRDDECSVYGDAENMIAALVAAGDAVADGRVSAEGSNALDPASDNAAIAAQAGQAGCEAAGGTWENSACTPASTYNCALGALCSWWADEYPEGVPYYTNNYRGDVPGVGAASTCSTTEWANAQDISAIFGDYLTAYLIDALLYGDVPLCE